MTRRVPMFRMRSEECKINTRNMKRKKERLAMLFNHVAVDEPPHSTCGAARHSKQWRTRPTLRGPGRARRIASKNPEK